MPIQTTFSNFEELLASSDRPLLVVFYASWCGPSHLMDSVLKQVSDRLDGQIKIVKINHESYPNLATQYHVHALPALVLFKDGQPIKHIESEETTDLISVESLIKTLQPCI